MILLVSTGNREGAQHALMKVFTLGDREAAPSKSAFCKFRKKISWEWFRDCLSVLIKQGSNLQSRWEGMKIYAIDGQQLTLPRSKDIIDNNFTGRATGKFRDTYMPKGYLTHLYDVLTGLTKQITLNPTLNEQADALSLLEHVEEGSLVLYDRLYFNHKLVDRHFKLGLRFVMRCRSNANKAIQAFFRSNKSHGSTKVEGKTIYLVKVKHPGSNDFMIIATNLPRSLRSPKSLAQLYRCRWEIELSFRELTDQTRTEQWHSKSLNGIKQELYTQLWLINYTKMNMAMAGQRPCQPQQKSYKKANFKLCYQFVVHYIGLAFDSLSYLFSYLRPVVKYSTERRKHFSRMYKREIKSPASPYSHYGSNWYWELN